MMAYVERTAHFYERDFLLLLLLHNRDPIRHKTTTTTTTIGIFLLFEVIQREIHLRLLFIDSNPAWIYRSPSVGIF
jgi:hypothetical protein